MGMLRSIKSLHTGLIFHHYSKMSWIKWGLLCFCAVWRFHSKHQISPLLWACSDKKEISLTDRQQKEKRGRSQGGSHNALWGYTPNHVVASHKAQPQYTRLGTRPHLSTTSRVWSLKPMSLWGTLTDPNDRTWIFLRAWENPGVVWSNTQVSGAIICVSPGLVQSSTPAWTQQHQMGGEWSTQVTHQLQIHILCLHSHLPTALQYVHSCGKNNRKVAQ